MNTPFSVEKVTVKEDYVLIEDGVVFAEVQFDDGKPNGIVATSLDGDEYDRVPEGKYHRVLTAIAVLHYEGAAQ